MTAKVRNGDPAVKRVMVYEDDGGCYVFHYTRAEDGHCDGDTWHEGLHDALSACAEQYGILEGDWTPVPDAEAGCQHDIIRPTRVTHDA